MTINPTAQSLRYERLIDAEYYTREAMSAAKIARDNSISDEDAADLQQLWDQLSDVLEIINEIRLAAQEVR